MNIFAFSNDPEQCAKWLDNSRVGKLLTEANQMMSVAVLENCPEAVRDVGIGGLCRPTHVNNSVTKWVRQSSGNFQWTLEYARALAAEYAHRYNGVQHGSAARIPTIESWDWVIPDGELTEFYNSARREDLGLDFTHLPVLQAYRDYANARWAIAKNPPRWHNRRPPTWYERSNTCQNRSSFRFQRTAST